MTTAKFILNDKTEQDFTGVTSVNFDGYTYTVVATSIEYLVPLTTDNVLSYTVS